MAKQDLTEKDRARIGQLVVKGVRYDECAKIFDVSQYIISQVVYELRYNGQIGSYEPDYGKIHALLDAGWTQAKIAQEFAVSPTTICRWLKEEKEKYGRKEI